MASYRQLTSPKPSWVTRPFFFYKLENNICDVDFKYRLATFTKWDSDKKPHPEDIADAGFIYLQYENFVVCPYCDEFLRIVPEIEPFESHIARSRKCGFFQFYLKFRDPLMKVGTFTIGELQKLFLDEAVEQQQPATVDSDYRGILLQFQNDIHSLRDENLCTRMLIETYELNAIRALRQTHMDYQELKDEFEEKARGIETSVSTLNTQFDEQQGEISKLKAKLASGWKRCQVPGNFKWDDSALGKYFAQRSGFPLSRQSSVKLWSPSGWSLSSGYPGSSASNSGTRESFFCETPRSPSPPRCASAPRFPTPKDEDSEQESSGGSVHSLGASVGAIVGGRLAGSGAASNAEDVLEGNQSIDARISGLLNPPRGFESITTPPPAYEH